MPVQVPVSGKATYSGLGLAKIGETSNSPFVAGTSSFDVDFGEKTIVGTVTEYQARNGVSLAGQINGNAFSGIKNGVEMRGYFYGSNAAELGGVFKGTTTINGIADTPVMGSFGAKKD